MKKFSPRFYKLDASLERRWDAYVDLAGHLWVGLGRYVFTTMPRDEHE